MSCGVHSPNNSHIGTTCGCTSCWRCWPRLSPCLAPAPGQLTLAFSAGSASRSTAASGENNYHYMGSRRGSNRGGKSPWIKGWCKTETEPKSDPEKEKHGPEHWDAKESGGIVTVFNKLAAVTQ